MLDERERLAREIHDTLAQGLTSIQLLLAAAHRSLAPAHTAEQQRASELVEQARLTAQENAPSYDSTVVSPSGMPASDTVMAILRVVTSAVAWAASRR